MPIYISNITPGTALQLVTDSDGNYNIETVGSIANNHVYMLNMAAENTMPNYGIADTGILSDIDVNSFVSTDAADTSANKANSPTLKDFTEFIESITDTKDFWDELYKDGKLSQKQFIEHAHLNSRPVRYEDLYNIIAPEVFNSIYKTQEAQEQLISYELVEDTDNNIHDDFITTHSPTRVNLTLRFNLKYGSINNSEIILLPSNYDILVLILNVPDDGKVTFDNVSNVRLQAYKSPEIPD